MKGLFTFAVFPFLLEALNLKGIQSFKLELLLGTECAIALIHIRIRF
jgi:hypothetical protein